MARYTPTSYYAGTLPLSATGVSGGFPLEALSTEGILKQLTISNVTASTAVAYFGVSSFNAPILRGSTVGNSVAYGTSVDLPSGTEVGDLVVVTTQQYDTCTVTCDGVALTLLTDTAAGASTYGYTYVWYTFLTAAQVAYGTVTYNTYGNSTTYPGNVIVTTWGNAGTPVVVAAVETATAAAFTLPFNGVGLTSWAWYNTTSPGEAAASTYDVSGDLIAQAYGDIYSTTYQGNLGLVQSAAVGASSLLPGVQSAATIAPATAGTGYGNITFTIPPLTQLQIAGMTIAANSFQSYPMSLVYPADSYIVGMSSVVNALYATASGVIIS